MLKIHDTFERNISEIRKKHYEKIMPYILKAIHKSKFNKKIKTEIRIRLELIITGNPNVLLIQEKYLYQFILTYRSNIQIINKELKKIFNYLTFSRRTLTSNWNAYKLAIELKVNTCVYCNRQYTFTIIKNSDKVTRPQFDHFFSQKDHPLLALSFYNLIPCCSICNLIKGDNPFQTSQYLHPYEKEYGDEGVFTYIPLDYKSIIGRSNNIKVKILEPPTGRNRASIKRQKVFFKLEEIYQEHSDYIQEIIWKGHISKGLYFMQLERIFGKGISRDDLYRLALGNYLNNKDMDKRVLSKLSIDIAKEIKLI